MPSLELVRHEALAAAVERARRSIVLTMVGIESDPLDTRVELVDGRTIPFHLKEVVVDGGELVGSGAEKQELRIPLPDVKAIWYRRLHGGRTVAAWALLIGATSGFVALVSTGPMVGAVAGGAILGMPLGVAVLVLLRRWKLLSEWVLLYRV